jgi:Carboxypeptidase regulatory-like domain
MVDRIVRGALPALLVLVVFLGQAALAQSSLGGSISGSVTDSSGAAISGASVRLTNDATGVVLTTTTTSAGQYVFPVVVVGSYTLTVTSQGFSQAVVTGLTVSPDKNTPNNVSLKVGTSTSTVEVKASSVHLETETAQQSTSIDQATYANLPLALNGSPRSPTEFSDLMPGVADAPSNSSTFNEPGENQIFSQSVNGGQTLASEIYYDGVSQMDTNVAGDYRNQPVPVDAISEFTLVQNNYSAEYSRTPGGVLSFNTRSGTNTWHGDAYEFNENNAMNARGWFNPVVPAERQNEFGGSAGGFIKRDKAFIFGYGGGFRFNANQPAFVTTIPTALMVKGDFTNYTDSSGHLIPIYDPTTTTFNPATGQYTRQQFSCNGVMNVICPSRFTAVATGFIPYIPTNYLNSNNEANFLGGGYTSDSFNRWGVKFDYNLTDKHAIHVFYGDSPWTVSYPQLVYKLPFTGIGFFEPDHSLITRFSDNYTINDRMLNYFAVGFNRYNETYSSLRDFTHITFGIQNIPDTTPSFGLGQYGPAGWQDPGQRVIDNGIGGSDFVSWIKGRHSVKIGGELRHYQGNTVGTATSGFSFSTAETNDPSAANPADTGNEFASFLIGAVDSANQSYSVSETTSHFWYMGLYVQDDFKVNRKFTLNVGLRYDIPWTRAIKNNIYSSFQPNYPNPGAGGIPGALVFAGTGQYHCNCTRFGNTQFNLFQPRLGFSYLVNKKTLVRSGIGVFEGSAGDVLENGTRILSDGYNANVNPATQNGGITPAFYIQNGFPAFPKPPIIDPSLDNGAGITWIAGRDGIPPRVVYWNIGVQRELGSFLLELSYVANRAQHISSTLYNEDQLDPKYLSLQGVLNEPLTPAISQQYNVPFPWPTFSGTVAQALRPFPQYTSISEPAQTSGWSHYNSFQAKLQRQFTSGVSLLVTYTYADALTTGESQHQYLDANGGAQNSFDLTHELTPSAVIPPQTLNLAYVYELPIGHGKAYASHLNPVANALIGGWQVSGIQHYQSGTTFNVDIPSDLTHPGPLSNYEFRPNLTGQPIKLKFAGSGVLLNAAAFSTPAPWTFGNAPRTLGTRLFAWNNENVSLSKRFSFKERYSFTLQGNAFNVFNRVSFGGVDTGSPNTNPDFGHVNGQQNSPRVLQVAGTLKF